MSFVISIVIDNKLYMASDGQVTDKDGHISTNNYKKIKRFGFNLLIGFAGDLEICKKICLTLDNTIIITDKMNPYTTASIISKKMEELYKNKYDKNKRICKFVIAGITNNMDLTAINHIKQYEIYTVESDNFQIKKQPISYGNEIQYVAFNSENISNDKVNKIVYDAFSNYLNYKDNVSEKLTGIIQRISTYDKTVNSNAFVEIIW